MMERVSKRSFLRELMTVEIRQSLFVKNTPEFAEESQMVIRTARSSRKDANERTDSVNLGGIAEVLPFVPYLGRKVFCFPHYIFKYKNRYYYTEEIYYAENSYLQ